MTEHTPTLVPTPNENISVCMGNAIDTAVSAFSLKCDTNMLSTMLYRACISIENIVGSDITASSLPTGMVPSLFSVCFLSIFSSISMIPFKVLRICPSPISPPVR